MRLRRPLTIAAALAVAISSSGVAFVAAPALAVPVPTELVASLVGDGSATLAVGPTAVFIDTVNSDGSTSEVPTVALPTAAADANQPFTLSGTSSAIGQLALAADGNSLAIAGYAATPGQAIGDPKDSLSSVAQRIVASIDADGVVDSSTVLTGAFSADHPRSVATADGESFYVSGNGTSKTPAAGVIRALRGSTAVPTAIAASPINSRNLAIAGGQLYTTASGGSDRGLWTVGSGLPTARAVLPAVDATRFATAPTGTPASFVMLDRDSTPGIDTAYYVLEDSGIQKWSLSAGTWVNNGGFPGVYQAITARVTDGVTELYLIAGTGTGNTITAATDTSALNASIAVSTPAVIATAPANTAYRGIAFAPTAWDPTPASDPTSTTTLTLSDDAATTVIGGELSTTLTIGTDGEDALDDFEVEVTASSNETVVPITSVEIAATGAERVLTVTPSAVGITALTITATNPADDSTATKTFTVAASALTPALAGVDYHSGSADASTAIALDDDYMLVADDESNTIRLYDRNVSGAAVKEFEFPELGSKEIDLEASARVGDTIYWFGSHGNNKDSEYKEIRSTFFSTTVSGTGTDTQLAYGSKYAGLRSDLLAWDAQNADRLGLDVACSLAGGTHPDETTGCNVEGFEFAPNGTTGYLGFRAPRVDGKAVIVPVTNITALVGQTTTHATFGDPILVDLGGRTIRELRSNGEGDYLITAGVPNDETSPLGWALYRWNGVATSAPYLVTALPAGTGDATQETGSFESIVDVPADLGIGDSIQLLTDNGTTVFYADGVAGKDVSPASLRKFRSNTVTVGGGLITAGTPTISGSAVVGQVLAAQAGTWAPNDVELSYRWFRGSETLATTATYTLTAADVATSVRVEVTGVRDGFVTESVSSDAFGPVATAGLTTGTATISGSAVVGATLTANAGTWAPNGVAFSYRWLRGTTEVGTGATYTLTPADASASIRVEVSGSLSGYAPANVTSAAVGPVATAPIAVGKVAVSGTRVVGRTLTATTGTWTPTGLAFSYQWKRNGVSIIGATSTKYTLKALDAGKTITVQVTGAKAGYTTTSASSAAVAVTGVFTSTPTPKISGTAKKGKTLTARAGTWKPAGVSLSYRWYRDGVAISGAVKAKYTLRSADKGERITVKVTGKKAGYTTVTKTSASKKVKK